MICRSWSVTGLPTYLHLRYNSMCPLKHIEKIQSKYSIKNNTRKNTQLCYLI